jgi:hypothetical protein
MRKVPTKYEYLLYNEWKLLFNELSSLLKKHEQILIYLNSTNKINFSLAEIRYFLGRMDVS